VAAVILYHAQVVGFSGGYIGVDVFFVISGFLITEVLVGSQGWPPRMALTDFYYRRGRRILPALFLTCAVTTVAAVVLLLPWDLQRYGGYLGATTVFANNIAAWVDEADYFDSRVAYAPLTHLWSIAVEEQFYVLYPLMLLLIAKLFPRYLFAALATVAVTSFIGCVWASYHHPLANFFLAPTRAWELLLGALLTTTRMQWKWNRWVCEIAALLSLSIIAFLVHVYSPLRRHGTADSFRSGASHLHVSPIVEADLCLWRQDIVFPVFVAPAGAAVVCLLPHHADTCGGDDGVDGRHLSPGDSLLEICRAAGPQSCRSADQRRIR